MHRLTILLSAVAAQIVVSNYPPMDVIAPVEVSWSHYYLANTVVPDLPVRSSSVPNPDWSQDILTCPGQNDWALTYDDGPGLPTPSVLASLREHNITATFFITGSRTIQYPNLVRQMYNDGHQIGIHTWAHRSLTTLTNDEIVAEIMYTARAIRDVIGVMPNYFRPPFGDIDPRVRAVLRAMGMQIILWNRDTEDAWSLNVNATFAQWFSQPQMGTISLQHDLFPSAGAQIPETLAMASRSGYRFRTVMSCLGRSDGYRSFPTIPVYVPPTPPAAPAQRANALPGSTPISTTTAPDSKTLNSDSGLHIAGSVFALALGFFFLVN
jgi:peptidoglycan/xylan/chitin deacetylase (PgdA/CDA1 family)